MRYKYHIKTLEDGRAMLNLGCGIKMNGRWNNIDFSEYARLAHHKTIAKILCRLGILSKERYQNCLDIDPEIICWDLRKGIPFPDESFDVVYNSHFLEHIKRDLVPSFLAECYRVLKGSGVIRIVVPDVQALVNRYTSAVSKLENEQCLDEHQQALYDLFHPFIPQEPRGTRNQHHLVRTIEKFIRGDLANIGQSHLWMYDKYSVEAQLINAGFKDIKVETPFSSRIDNWNEVNLDVNEDDSVYKSNSLYEEGIK